MPRKPKPAILNPAATLPGEADILANVLADLSDDHAKLVYADWLEEHDDKRGPLLRNFVKAHRAGKKLPAVKSAPKPWCDLVGITLMMAVRDTVLAPEVDAIFAAVRPALTFRFARAPEKSLPIGASKFGGRPDMPAKSDWPEDNGVPLTFLMQINLAELRASPVSHELPATGLLSLFCLYDYGEDFTEENWRLLHFPDATNLVRHEQHPKLYAEEIARSARLSFAEALTLPDDDSPWHKALLKALRALDPKDVAYSNLRDGMGDDGLLGHPRTFEGDVLGKKSMRHLLTIGESDSTGWWPDGNMMYVTIPTADLKQGQFDRAKATLQTF